ncbi:hypothetical protein GCK72_002270 [Caenorhabditis remanei]|uniref:Uncharacterized protein n=1 Tax=Caenorhabditis remanei TaxID=31234 RepID=A0A6A5HTK1_CAERE|nr:hypothetical protein GCK72_002270 [Caenorhabditis remanei]KAF1770451.1 hypothetical protein GCK72_002270 [Caenorhabditis remanei]
MDSDEEIMSSYSSVILTASTETTISTRDSASNAVPAVVDINDEEVFEDASSDISILTKKQETLVHLDRNKMRKAVHQDLCTHTQKVYEPLFLRKCELQKARQRTAPPDLIPIQKVGLMEANQKMSGHSALLMSLNTPTYCVRYMAANAIQKPKNVLVYASPINFVRFVARPEPQRTTQSVFEDPSETVHLMMSPDESIVARRLLPRWQTVTFTLAFGKNMAVKYRIIETRKQPVIYVKAKVDHVKRVSTSTLYRTEPEQRVEYWTCFKANDLKLSTVEKNDPQIVKKVFFETAGIASSNHSINIGTGDMENKNLKKRKTVKSYKELNLMWQRTDEY